MSIAGSSLILPNHEIVLTEVNNNIGNIADITDGIKESLQLILTHIFLNDRIFM